jgi:hypothetical protein
MARQALLPPVFVFFMEHGTAFTPFLRRLTGVLDVFGEVKPVLEADRNGYRTKW